VKQVRFRKTKATCLLSYRRWIQKINTYTKQTGSYTNLYVEHACNSEIILQSLGKERQEKGMIEHQQYCNTSVKVEDIMVSIDSC
jgi:hypothetical protein